MEIRKFFRISEGVVILTDWKRFEDFERYELLKDNGRV